MTELGEDTQAELDVKKEPKNGESDTIKLSDLNSDLDEKFLKKFFMKAGKIRRIFAPEDKNFAYVSFDDSNDAVKDLKLDMKELGDDVTAELDVKNPNSGGSRGGRGGDRGGRGGRGGDRGGRGGRGGGGGFRGGDRGGDRGDRGGDRRGGGGFRGGDRGGRGGRGGDRGRRGGRGGDRGGRGGRGGGRRG